MIQCFQPYLGIEELNAINEVFATNWIGKGNVTQQFTRNFADYIRADPDRLTTLNNATEGLFLAMQLLDIGLGDEVILPSISFVGAANAVMSCGARPIFCDVDERTLNPTLQHIKAVRTLNTQAIIVLDYGGRPVNDIWAIEQYAEENGIYLIEDCALSVGASVQGKACGTIGAIGIWSFDAMKHIAIGTGGMIWCKDAHMADRARLLTCCGMPPNTASGYGNAQSSRWWEFNVIDPTGRNNLFDDIRAAIGIAQLSNIGNNLHIRSTIADMYDQQLANIDWLRRKPVYQPANTTVSNAFYWIQVLGDDYSRDKLAMYLRKQGIYTTFRYYPLHTIKAYHHDSSVQLPNTEWVAEHTLLLPMHASLQDYDVEYICNTIRDYDENKW